MRSGFCACIRDGNVILMSCIGLFSCYFVLESFMDTFFTVGFTTSLIMMIIYVYIHNGSNKDFNRHNF